MVTKKILTLGLALTLMSPLASFAKMGAESGGGGDAVMVDNKLVIRDLLPGQMQTVTSNLKYINSVKGFRKLIHTIAKVNPDFASSIILDLSRTTIYTTKEKLQLLPYDQTTLAGRAAEVQLAVRIDNDIIFGAEFLDYEEAEYVLLHEALHGLLSNNSGPMHHVRVRAIVKYIHENIDQLNAEELRIILFKNNYVSKIQFESGLINSTFWNEKNESLKCSMAYHMGTSELSEFEKLNCLEGSDEDSYRLNLAKFMSDKYPEIVAARDLLKDIRSGEDSVVTYRSNYKFNLDKISFLNSSAKKEQKRRCSDNDQNLRTEMVYNQERSKLMILTEQVKTIIKDKNVSEIEKIAILDFMSGVVGNAYGMYIYLYPNSVFSQFDLWVYKLNSSMERSDYRLEFLNDQQSACKNKYPEL